MDFGELRIGLASSQKGLNPNLKHSKHINVRAGVDPRYLSKMKITL